MCACFKLVAICVWWEKVIQKLREGGVPWGAEEKKELTIKMALYAQMGLSVLSFSDFAGCILDNLLLTQPKLR